MAEIKLLCIDSKYQKEIEEDETFLVKTNIDYSTEINKREIELMDSIFSYKFEIKESHPKEIIELRYKCVCGFSKGQQKLGTICPKCDTKVEKKLFPTSKVAYIKCPEKVTNMITLMMLEKVLGPTKYKQLIGGQLQGIDSIYTKFDYILDNHVKKKKEIEKLVEFMRKNKEVLFSNMIPVISSKVRYMSHTQNMGVSKIDTHNLNTPLIHIANHVQLMKESNATHAPNVLKKLYFEIHKQLDEYKDVLIKTFGGDKRKLLRDAVYGTRMPYTSWAVLAPLTEYYDMNSCTIPIETFRCCFKDDIKEILTEMGYSKVYINMLLSVQYIMDKGEKEILKTIFTMIKDKYIYINRQPTMGKGSIQILEVREIRDEYVLRLHPNVLDWLGGDHDGDALVILGLRSDIRKDMHETLSPESYAIDYDYKVNCDMGLKNDYLILFNVATRDVEEEE